MRQEDIEEKRARRKRSAVQGVLLFALFQLFMAACFGAVCFVPGVPGPVFWLFFALAALCLLLLVPAALVLKKRFLEIEGGELDAAGKY